MGYISNILGFFQRSYSIYSRVAVGTWRHLCVCVCVEDSPPRKAQYIAILAHQSPAPNADATALVFLAAVF